MRRIVLLSVLLAACGDGGSDAPRTEGAADVSAAPPGAAAPSAADPASPSSAAAAGDGAESGVFAVLRGGQPILRETFRRTGDRLETEMSAPGEGRAAQVVTLRPDHGVSRLEVRVYDGRSASPNESLLITMRGDSATVEANEGGNVQRASIAAAPDAIPVPVNQSVAMVEQILRRARAAGGNEVEVPILGSGGKKSTVRVTFTGADAARIQTEDSDWTVQTDAQGRLLGGRSADGLTIQRSSGGG